MSGDHIIPLGSSLAKATVAEASAVEAVRVDDGLALADEGRMAAAELTALEAAESDMAELANEADTALLAVASGKELRAGAALADIAKSTVQRIDLLNVISVVGAMLWSETGVFRCCRCCLDCWTPRAFIHLSQLTARPPTTRTKRSRPGLHLLWHNRRERAPSPWST